MKNQTQDMIILICALLLSSTLSARAQTEPGTRNQTTAPDSVTVSSANNPYSTAGSPTGTVIQSSNFGTAITALTESMGSQCRNVQLANAADYAKGVNTGYWPTVPFGTAKEWQSFIGGSHPKFTVSLCTSNNCTQPAIGVWEECNAGLEQNLLPTPATSKFYSFASVNGPPAPPPAACGTVDTKCEFNCAPPYRFTDGNRCYWYFCGNYLGNGMMNTLAQPSNSTRCTLDGDPYDETFLTANRDFTTVTHGGCTATKCEYECALGYRVVGNGCFPYNCVNPPADTTHMTSCLSLGSDPLDESPLGGNVSWSTTLSCDVDTYCEYKCNAGYKPSGNTCIPYACVNAPSNLSNFVRCSTQGDVNDETGLMADTDWHTIAYPTACNVGTSCEYLCPSTYYLSGTGVNATCAGPYFCTGANPLNASVCPFPSPNDDVGLSSDVPKHVTLACSANNSNNARHCEYVCSGGYVPACIAASLSLNGTTASFHVTTVGQTAYGVCASGGGVASAQCVITGILEPVWGAASGSCCPAGQTWNGSACN